MKRKKARIPQVVDEVIEKSDIILFVLDARFLDETRNPALEEKILKLWENIDESVKLREEKLWN